ncbi:19521_t:CDS:2 [Gigaspora margarita]|uniref:19521_t:CDS:1 n=1 Tax=Gigaspora margarita TaxID=4874 RepID=A0ABM8W392_GIGMA|nr:19521_t:CDS:2 [Gigaspora margarita]
MLEESNIINQNIVYNNYDTLEDTKLIGRESYEDVSYEVSSKFSDPITTKSIRINSFKTRLLVNELKQFNSVQPHVYILEFYGITKSELSTQSTKTTAGILLRELSCSQESYNCESELYYISKSIISGKSVNRSSISSIGYVNNYKDFYKSLNSNFTDSSNLSIINSKKELKSIAIINSKFLDYMNINMNDPNKKESFHQLLQLSINPAKLLQTLLDHNQDENSTFARLIGFFYKYGFNSSSSS